MWSNLKRFEWKLMKWNVNYTSYVNKPHRFGIKKKIVLCKFINFVRKIQSKYKNNALQKYTYKKAEKSNRVSDL